MGSKGIVASSAALGVLLQEGIGDTIRVSLTPEPGGDRTLEVQGRRRKFCRRWASAPSCRWSRPAPAAAARPRRCSRNWRATSRPIIRDAMPSWRTQYPGVEALNVAVMGCIVNGPGESQARRHRHFAAGHRAKRPAAPVFIDGQKADDAARRGHSRRIHPHR